jgi:hypothetical protein
VKQLLSTEAADELCKLQKHQNLLSDASDYIEVFGQFKNVEQLLHKQQSHEKEPPNFAFLQRLIEDGCNVKINENIAKHFSEKDEFNRAVEMDLQDSVVQTRRLERA